MDVISTADAPPAPDDDWALFLDVDGCLVPHEDTPDLAIASPEMCRHLQALADRLDGAVALVSGRSIQSLDQLFSPFGVVCAAGLHGLERRNAQSTQGAPQAPAAIDSLAREVESLASRYPRTLVERHGPCLNLHWRAAPHAAADFTQFAHSALPRLPGYRLHVGAHGIEIRPEGMDKGVAIHAFLNEPPFRGRRPVFAGDDVADERGFAVVNAHDGISVLVGDRDDTVAHYRLPDPSAVHRWLGVPIPSDQERPQAHRNV